MSVRGGRTEAGIEIGCAARERPTRCRSDPGQRHGARRSPEAAGARGALDQQTDALDEPRRHTLTVRGGMPSALTRLRGANELERLFVGPEQVQDGRVQARPAVVHQQGAPDCGCGAIGSVSVLLALV